ncbi:MAG: Mur ligase domain-containing protein [Collinsella sp.]
MFVAFPGENVDGNDFASRAVQSGAGAVVMTREPEAELVSLAQDKGCAILLTDDPEEFLLRLAHVSPGAWLPGRWHYRFHRQDDDQGRARRRARQALSCLGHQGQFQ